MAAIIIISEETTISEYDGSTWRNITFQHGKRTPSVSVVTDKHTGDVAYWVGGMSAHPAARAGKRFETLDAMLSHYRKSIAPALIALFAPLALVD